ELETMSTTDDRDTITKLQADLAAAQASTAKMQAEIETLRAKIWNRRHSLAGKINDNQIQKAIKQARIDGERRTLSDGGGLHLQVFPTPGRGLMVSWLFRWSDTISKNKYKPRSVGLGALNYAPLATARDMAQRCRDWLREGKDPKVELALLKYRTE